jgi:hypothetical protein
METIIINTRKSGNAKFILELVEKLGENGRILNKEEQEDFLLGSLMQTEKTGKTVSRATIFKKLKAK